MAYTPYQIKDNAASTFYVQTSTFGGNGGTTTTGIVNVFDLVAVGGTAIAMGQQTAAASFPVVLPAAQITALTPPSTISVSSLPSLPTGTNAIGSVTVTALPSLPAGSNTIGTVNLSASTITALTPPATVGVNTNADGSFAGGAAATKSFAVGGVYNTSLPTLTNGQQAAIQVDSSGRQIVVVGPGTSSIGTVALDTTNSTYLSTISTAQGAGGTGISQPTGGSGLLGWLSGIYKAITGTLTVSGGVTANAGTNLNTSLLALESGGNLAGLNTTTGTTADAAYTSGNGTIVSLLKGVFGYLGTLAGAVSSSKVQVYQPGTTPTAGTVSATTTAATLTSTACSAISVQNDPTSAVTLQIGTASGSQPYKLTPGSAITITCSNASQIYVSTASGTATVNYLVVA